MSGSGGAGEMQRLLSSRLDVGDGDAPASAPWLLVGFVLVWFAGTLLGLYHPGIEGSPNIVISVMYGSLGATVYVLSVIAGPVPVVDRLLAGTVTFAWFYVMGPVETALSRTVDANVILEVLVPAGVIVGATAHVVWRSGVTKGVRHPQELYAHTRNLALIYGLTIYFAAGNVVLAL